MYLVMMRLVYQVDSEANKIDRRSAELGGFSTACGMRPASLEPTFAIVQRQGLCFRSKFRGTHWRNGHRYFHALHDYLKQHEAFNPDGNNIGT